MTRINLQGFLVIFLFFCLILLCSGLLITSPVEAQNPSEAQNFFELQELDERSDGFFFMKDLESEDVIMKTARLIRPGDEYITSENKLYCVERIEGDIAWARFKEEIKLFEGNLAAILKDVHTEETVFQESQPETSVPRLGIYHSHGAESYVPSDGVESITEGGGILQVGRSFVENLREKGLKVNYSSQTHIPHDAGAYNRSRRTAEQFLHQGVGTLFDIHRDAVPAEEYTAQVENTPTVQVQIVVGQQNQNAQANRNFAEGLKKVADSIHPGLVKGIFMASGNYNQDILPLSLLFEVGTHETTREGAARSMALFSDVVKVYFLGEPGRQAREGMGSTALRSILWIIFIAGLALGGYLLVGTGSLEELRSKLRQFFGREFAEFGGKRSDGEGDGEHGDNDTV
jgi:stage II sporulation protein P